MDDGSDERMDDDYLVEPEVEEADEYTLESQDTDDLDEAMREALEAVERSEEHLESAAVKVAAESESAPPPTVNDDFALLQSELAELRDRSVRTLADFDNYRKRVARERREERRYATIDLAREILGVVDNLERALSAEGSTEDLKQGVVLIHRQLQETLRRHGVHRVAAEGEPFDPAVHEAVARFEDPDIEEPTVSEELQSGYLLHDRLLRPAMVKVALPAGRDEQRDRDEQHDRDEQREQDE